MTGAANACPICQAHKISELQAQIQSQAKEIEELKQKIVILSGK